MSDVDLDTGTVVAEYDGGAPPEGQSIVVGAPPQWDDGDAETAFAVVKSALVSDVGWYGNASSPVIGDATKAAAINGLIRWLPDEGGESPALMRASLRVDGIEAVRASFSRSGSGIQFAAVQFYSPNVLPESGFTWTEVCAAVIDDRVEIVVGIGYIPDTGGPNPTATIYDVLLSAHYLDRRIAPPARLHPREDGLGVGGARQFPGPASHQNSGRFAGGYY